MVEVGVGASSVIEFRKFETVFWEHFQSAGYVCFGAAVLG